MSGTYLPHFAPHAAAASQAFRYASAELRRRLNETLRVAVNGRAQHLVRSAVLRKAPLAHDRRFVCDHAGKRQIVRHDYLPDASETAQAHQLLRRFEPQHRVEGARRLVAQQKLSATLIGLNALYDLRFTTEQLQEIGVKLGADIPYCIMGGTALSQGIGEILRPLPAPPQAHLVIAKPDLMISTKYVYENLHANSLKVHPNIDGMIEALSNRDLIKMCSLMGNVLETVTEKENPIITQIKDLMKEQGATGALMSGSGPTVFSIFTEEEKARNCFQKIQEENLAKQLFLTGFHNTGNPT